MSEHTVLPFCYTCRYSSVVERALRKRTVVGSIPTGGLVLFNLKGAHPPYAQFCRNVGMREKWNRRGLNPGPSACKADVIPLHHNPMSPESTRPIEICYGSITPHQNFLFLNSAKLRKDVVRLRWRSR